MVVNRSESGRLLRIATVSAVAVAFTLFLVKLIAWLATDSLSLMASMVDSLADGFASLINLLAVSYALMPADREHRFGHGKAESLAGLVQSAFMAGAALFLALSAVDRLINPQPLERTGWGIAVMLFAMALTWALVMVQRRAVEQTGSVAVEADSVHYLSDFLTNGGVILSLLSSRYLGWQIVDPLCAFGVTVYLGFSAFRIGGVALNSLLDREFDDPERERILNIARKNERVLDVHDLRTRRSGPDAFIQLHLEMEDALPLVEAHAIGEAVRLEILREFPEAEVIIHQDPISTVSPQDRAH
ncbi:MAG: cation diffusion facilitator family transporter [Pseudomonadota bacterium]|nr:cation diffusion facilitator family transporter [Pseudomonadota bacterium]